MHIWEWFNHKICCIHVNEWSTLLISMWNRSWLCFRIKRNFNNSSYKSHFILWHFKKPSWNNDSLCSFSLPLPDVLKRACCCVWVGNVVSGTGSFLKSDVCLTVALSLCNVATVTNGSIVTAASLISLLFACRPYFLSVCQRVAVASDSDGMR